MSFHNRAGRTLEQGPGTGTGLVQPKLIAITCRTKDYKYNNTVEVAEISFNDNSMHEYRSFQMHMVTHRCRKRSQIPHNAQYAERATATVPSR